MTLIRSLSAITLIFAATPAVAQAPAADLPRLNLEQETAMRCSAAFAIVSSEQAHGTPLGASWPRLDKRAREFFVRAGARLMDETGATRPQVQALFARSASELRGNGQDLPARLASLRGPCQTLLDIAVPPG